MQEVRCEKCNKLLYRIDRPNRTVIPKDSEVVVSEITPEYMGKIECKCPRCGEINIHN